MTPAAENSQWVANEIQHARNHRRSIVPLLLDGKPFLALAASHYEDVRGGKMPGERLVQQLRRLGVAWFQPSPQVNRVSRPNLESTFAEIKQAGQSDLPDYAPGRASSSSEPGEGLHRRTKAQRRARAKGAPAQPKSSVPAPTDNSPYPLGSTRSPISVASAEAEANQRRAAATGRRPDMEAEQLREGIKRLVRKNDIESYYGCPECTATVKGRNLVRHMDEQHFDRPGRRKMPLPPDAAVFDSPPPPVRWWPTGHLAETVPSTIAPPVRGRSTTSKLVMVPAGIARNRNEMKQLIRTYGMDSGYACSRCDAAVRGKNLIRHMDERHGW